MSDNERGFVRAPARPDGSGTSLRCGKFSLPVMNYTGKGFLCVGDAHRFINPIFAYGIFFATQEGEFAAKTIARFLSEGTRINGNPFAEYEALCDRGNDITQDFSKPQPWPRHRLADVIPRKNIPLDDDRTDSASKQIHCRDSSSRSTAYNNDRVLFLRHFWGLLAKVLRIICNKK